MKSLKIFLILLIFLITLAGCSKDNVLKGNGIKERRYEKLEVIQYNLKIEKINFKDNFIPKLSINYASMPDATKILIESDENIISLIELNIVDNQIIISSNTESVIEVDKFQFYFSCNIKDIEVNGNYEIDLEPGQSQGSNIILNGNYTGNIRSEGALYTASNITIIGNGKLDLSLKCFLDNFKCIYNGNSKISAPYALENVSLSFNGYNEFIGRISGSLNVFINGEGYVNYYDDRIPTEITTSINGLGYVKKIR